MQLCVRWNHFMGYAAPRGGLREVAARVSRPKNKGTQRRSTRFLCQLGGNGHRASYSQLLGRINAPLAVWFLAKSKILARFRSRFPPTTLAEKGIVSPKRTGLSGASLSLVPER